MRGTQSGDDFREHLKEAGEARRIQNNQRLNSLRGILLGVEKV
jgi:hypothetical protein